MSETSTETKYETATAAIVQLESCGFVDQHGHPLENNEAFKELKTLAEQIDNDSVTTEELIETGAQFGFGMAFALLEAGHKIKRASQDRVYGYGEQDDGCGGGLKGIAEYVDGKVVAFCNLTGEDMFAQDWTVIE